MARGVRGKERAPNAVRCHFCKGPIHGRGVVAKMRDERRHVFCCRTCKTDFAARLARLSKR
ncbi:MAG: TRASH domain-containing protein [Thermoplasmatota archaeon]